MKPDRRSFLVASGALLAGGILPVGPAPVGPARDGPRIPPESFLGKLPRIMDLASVPGLGIVVVHQGRVAWNRAFGLANAETKAPITDQTLFAAASLGKPAFAWVVLGLAEEGKLDLDRPLVAYHRPDDLPAEPALGKITPRHVLTHTTGLRNWRGQADQKLAADFEPGTRFQYSGEGFYWLQRVVEVVTGRPVDRVMRKRLFDPAGMPDATYARSPAQVARTVAGHSSRGAVATQSLDRKLLGVAEKWGKPMADWTVPEALAALPEADPGIPRLPNWALPNVAGSLVCTPVEYARFLTRCLPDGRPAGAPRDASAADRTTLFTPGIAIKQSLSWGHGFGLERTEGGQFFWQWGDNGVHKAFVVGDPTDRRAIAVFANGSGGDNVYRPLIGAATGLEFDAFVWV